MLILGRQLIGGSFETLFVVVQVQTNSLSINVWFCADGDLQCSQWHISLVSVVYPSTVTVIVLIRCRWNVFKELFCISVF